MASVTITGKWRIETVEINGDVEIFGIRVRCGDGSTVALASGDSWEWTATLPDANGLWAHGAPPTDWQQASVIDAQGTWASADTAFTAGLAGTGGLAWLVRLASR